MLLNQRLTPWAPTRLIRPHVLYTSHSKSKPNQTHDSFVISFSCPFCPSLNMFLLPLPCPKLSASTVMAILEVCSTETQDGWNNKLWVHVSQFMVSIYQHSAAWLVGMNACKITVVAENYHLFLSKNIVLQALIVVASLWSCLINQKGEKKVIICYVREETAR